MASMSLSAAKLLPDFSVCVAGASAASASALVAIIDRLLTIGRASVQVMAMPCLFRKPCDLTPDTMLLTCTSGLESIS